MIDCHVHLEKEPYTREWLDEFINQAIKINTDVQLCKIKFINRKSTIFEQS